MAIDPVVELTGILAHHVTHEQLIYAARRLTAEHRPIRFSEGDVVTHAEGCDLGQPSWYERNGAGDPDLKADPEVVSAHYGPPCQNPYGIEFLCASDHGDGPTSWPCWEALAAAGLHLLLDAAA